MSKSKKLSKVETIALSDALGERYLAYALSTITSRSLPDVRDGLKPVQRRLLFAMRELKLDPKSGHKKCARVVGDVIGKFHPHGDTAVYDALVRLAQSFSVRWPLVEGHGNFGNIDGDNAAAMRYTEARLTDFATSLLEGISEDAVDFRNTYDGQEEEPLVLPAAVPNLLCNGASGIAVGLATNIPPHNLEELCEAILLLLQNQRTAIDDLLKVCPGPDFPTGGVLVESAALIRDAYKSGRGSLRLRARWEVEKLGRGQWQIIVTEIPYQVQKSKLIERIAELLENRKIALLGDVSDESAEDVRILLGPKNRSVDPAILMEMLFKQTDLEVRIGLNMNVLDADSVPKIMGLREMLLAFIAHRYSVLQRINSHRLKKIIDRINVLEGYLIVYLNLDKVIRIIREEDEPKKKLMKTFKLNDLQAESVLNMRLRSLRKLEEVELKREHKGLRDEKQQIQRLLASKTRQKTALRNEIQNIKKRFGKSSKIGIRRTEIFGPPKSVDLSVELLVEREPVTVICSDKGWVRTIKGHVDEQTEVRYKEGDKERFRFFAETTDKLILFATNGRFYTLLADKLSSGRGYGEPIRLMADIGNENDIVSFFVYDQKSRLLVVSDDGRGFFVDEKNIIAQTKSGKQVLNVKDPLKASICIPAIGDSVALIGENRKLLIFRSDEIPIMNRGRGVILQRYRDGKISDAQVFNLSDGLSWRSGKSQRTEADISGWVGKRGQSGRLPPKGFPRNNLF
tara:strand:- start:41010 stop:43229 length:2220 start_codon:yes stop_codon:yes gene_type:complete